MCWCPKFVGFYKGRGPSVSYTLYLKEATSSMQLVFQTYFIFSDFNKGGDPIWYYNSQELKPEVQEKFREMEIVPFDNPP